MLVLLLSSCSLEVYLKLDLISNMITKGFKATTAVLVLDFLKEGKLFSIRILLFKRDE